MRKFAASLAVVLLLFNGFGALYGGWSLMTDPTGNQLQLPLSALEHTPFPDFLVPGTVLFFCIGVFSFVALTAMVFASRNYPLYILAEGCLLTGWIVIQLLWTGMYHPWQAMMGALGLLLMGCGWTLYKTNKKTVERVKKQQPLRHHPVSV